MQTEPKAKGALPPPAEYLPQHIGIIMDGNGRWAKARGMAREYGHRRGSEVFMDIRVQDILVMKKAHPCGDKRWEVLRTGMDFRLRCLGCGHEVMLPRSKAEKNIRQVLRDGAPV